MQGIYLDVMAYGMNKKLRDKWKAQSPSEMMRQFEQFVLEFPLRSQIAPPIIVSKKIEQILRKLDTENTIKWQVI